MAETAWLCIAAVAIVGIIALALIFKNQPQQLEQPVSFVYDDQNRLQSLVPMNTTNVKLKPI